MTLTAAMPGAGARSSRLSADPNTCGVAVEPLLLVEEFSHRVVNEYAGAISAINLEAARIADPGARAVLKRTTEKLHAFAEAHRALQAPVTLDEVCIGDYLDRVCSALSEASLRERGVKLILVEDDVVLPAVRCWRAALIVAELITNSVKHGFKADGGGIVVVELRQSGGDVFCMVADNGGCPPDPSPSRGCRVVERLAGELQGEVRWCFEPRGVTATLRFPVSPDLPRLSTEGATR